MPSTARCSWARPARDERPITIRLPLDDPMPTSSPCCCSARGPFTMQGRVPPTIRPEFDRRLCFRRRCGRGAVHLTARAVHAALRAEAAKTPPGGRARQQMFRSSFLAVICRPDRRTPFGEVTAHVESAATSTQGPALVPALIARGESAVEDSMTELFGTLESVVVRGNRRCRLGPRQDCRRSGPSQFGRSRCAPEAAWRSRLKFTRDELAAFNGAAVDDLIDDRVRLLFVGINPGLWTAAVNAHFARRGNRFWPALHAAGITPRLVDVSDGMSAEDRATGARARDRHHQHRSHGQRPRRRVDPSTNCAPAQWRCEANGAALEADGSSRCSVSPRIGKRSPNRRLPQGRQDRPARRCRAVGAAEPERPQRPRDHRQPGEVIPTCLGGRPRLTRSAATARLTNLEPCPS